DGEERHPDDRDRGVEPLGQPERDERLHHEPAPERVHGEQPGQADHDRPRRPQHAGSRRGCRGGARDTGGQASPHDHPRHPRPPGAPGKAGRSGPMPAAANAPSEPDAVATALYTPKPRARCRCSSSPANMACSNEVKGPDSTTSVDNPPPNATSTSGHTDPANAKTTPVTNSAP